MRIIQIQLYVLMWCQAAKTVDQLTDFGQNVTINCDLDANDVYWILLKQSDSPTVILRSFSNPTSAFHLNKTFKNKYSVQSKHRLVIYNVTVDELGVYYCMNTDTPPKLSNSTRLHIIHPTQPTTFTVYLTVPNHTVVNCVLPNQTQRPIFIIISALMNAVLLIVLIVGGCYSGKRSKHHDIGLQNTKYMYLEQPEGLKDMQYTAVSFSMLS